MGETVRKFRRIVFLKSLESVIEKFSGMLSQALRAVVALSVVRLCQGSDWKEPKPEAADPMVTGSKDAGPQTEAPNQTPDFWDGVVDLRENLWKILQVAILAVVV